MRAREGPLLREISEILGLTIIPMGSTSALGSLAADFKPWAADDIEHLSMLAEVLADHDEQTLTNYIEKEGRLPLEELLEQLRTQTEHGLVQPVFFGSARTGAGIDSLMSGIADLLPPTPAAIPRLTRRARSSRSSVERLGKRSPMCGCSQARCEPAIASSTAKGTRT